MNETRPIMNVTRKRANENHTKAVVACNNRQTLADPRNKGVLRYSALLHEWTLSLVASAIPPASVKSISKPSSGTLTSSCPRNGRKGAPATAKTQSRIIIPRKTE